MSIDDPWAKDESEPTQAKTFWLKPSTLAKLKALQESVPDPDKIIARVKRAMEREIDELYEKRPNK